MESPIQIGRTACSAKIVAKRLDQPGSAGEVYAPRVNFDRAFADEMLKHHQMVNALPGARRRATFALPCFSNHSSEYTVPTVQKSWDGRINKKCLRGEPRRQGKMRFGSSVRIRHGGRRSSCGRWRGRCRWRARGCNTPRRGRCSGRRGARVRPRDRRGRRARRGPQR